MTFKQRLEEGEVESHLGKQNSWRGNNKCQEGPCARQVCEIARGSVRPQPRVSERKLRRLQATKVNWGSGEKGRRATRGGGGGRGGREGGGGMEAIEWGRIF